MFSKIFWLDNTYTYEARFKYPGSNVKISVFKFCRRTYVPHRIDKWNPFLVGLQCQGLSMPFVVPAVMDGCAKKTNLPMVLALKSALNAG